MIAYPRESTALLLIDPLNDFIAEGGKLWPYVREVAERVQLLAHLRELVAAVRASGLPVLFVPHHRHAPGDFQGFRFMNPSHAGAQRLLPFERGSWGAEFHADFQPEPGDLVIAEHWLHSGFCNTDLDYQLRNRGIDRLILAGMRGNACIEGTARHAVELGYHVTLVKDATATFSYDEWRASMEINGPGIVHSVVNTAELVSALAASPASCEPPATTRERRRA